MVTRLFRLAALGAALLLVLPARGAQAPKDNPKDDPKDDPSGDALPKDAKVRLGGGRMVFRYAPAFSLLPPDFKTILVPDVQGGIRRFDAATGRPLDKHPGDGTGGGQVVVSRDGKRLVVVRSGNLSLRDAVKGDAIQEIKPPPGFTTAFSYNMPSVSLSADGKVLAQGGVGQGKDRKGEVVVWDVEKNELLARVEVLQTGPAVPVLSPDGTILATRGAQPTFGPGGARPDPDPNRTVQVWSVETGKELFKCQVSGTAYQISAVAFSPSGATLATSCGDGPIDLWEVKTWKLKTTLLGRTRQGLRVAFSPDGKTLAAVSIDGTIQRWSVADGKMIGTTEGPAVLPLSVAQGLDFADNDRVLAWGVLGLFPVVWEAPSGKILTPLPEHSMAIKSIGFGAGGKEVVTAGLDGKLVRWDAATGKPLGELTLRPGRALTTGPARFAVNLSPDGTRALTVGAPAALFDVTTGAEILAIPPALGPGFTTYTIPAADLTKAISLSVSFDAKRPGGCVVWDLVAQKKLAEVELQAAGGLPPAAAVSPSGTRLVTAAYAPNPGGGAVGGRPTLVVTGWDLKTGKKLGQVEDTNSGGQVFIAVASESSAIVAAGGGRVRLYDYETGKAGDEIEAPGNRGFIDPSAPIVFSADGKRFALGVPTEEQGVYGVRVYDWPSGKALHTFVGHRAAVSAIAFSPDGKTLASGSQDTTVILWDMSVVKGE
jgi:WD40 repeat protein